VNVVDHIAESARPVDRSASRRSIAIRRLRRLKTNDFSAKDILHFFVIAGICHDRSVCGGAIKVWIAVLLIAVFEITRSSPT